MTSIGICIDNQERLNYPVDFITRSLDRFDVIYWFVPNQLQADILKPLRAFHPLRKKIEIVMLPFCEIFKPDHIAKFQNRAMEYMREYAVYCILRADVLPSQKGLDTLFSWINGEIYKECNHVTVQGMMCKLYCEMWAEPFVLSAARKGFRYEAIGDGGEELHTQIIGKEISENSDFSIGRMGFDLGYFSVKQYYRKCMNHYLLWGGQEKLKFIELVDNGDIISAVRFAIAESEKSAQRKLKIFPKDSEWYGLVTKFGLEAEYELVSKMLAE